MNTKKFSLRRFLLLALVVCVCLTFLFPLYWIIVTAVKPTTEVSVHPPTLWPSRFEWGNFANVLADYPIMLWFRNTAIVAFVATIITIALNLLAGYAFAKYEFRFKGALFMVVLSTLMIPRQVIMVPSFIIVSRLNLSNTFTGLILPVCAEAFGLFMARQFISEIPDSLLEAGRIDGCSELGLFTKIVLPNVRPLISVLVIYTIRWRWNDFQWPLIVVSKQEMYTLQLGIKNISGFTAVNWNDVMCASLIALIPVAIIFLIFQKQFVEGSVSSGIKG